MKFKYSSDWEGTEELSVKFASYTHEYVYIYIYIYIYVKLYEYWDITDVFNFESQSSDQEVTYWISLLFLSTWCC